MRVLIYSESAAAIARRDELRAEGHHASMRNPQYFNPAQFDKSCDLVIADDPVVVDAYRSAEIVVEPLTAKAETPAVESEPMPPTVNSEKTSTPVSKSKKGK